MTLWTFGDIDLDTVYCITTLLLSIQSTQLCHQSHSRAVSIHISLPVRIEGQNQVFQYGETEIYPLMRTRPEYMTLYSHRSVA